MCGRTFCAIDPACIQKSCQYTNPTTGQYICPEWVDAPTGEAYRPSYNIGPTIFTPVLLSASHKSSGQRGTRVLQPMRWGLVPQWHKGGRTTFKAMHNNCRGETINGKSTFSTPYSNGKRCVVIAEGFYEWKTDGSKKTPYLFTNKGNTTTLVTSSDITQGVKNDIKHEVKADNPQENVVIEQDVKTVIKHISAKTETGTSTNVKHESDQKDGNLLFMAGIFDVCKEKDGLLYSYSIITTEAVGAVAQIHHRMPVILDSDQAIERWLNFEQYTSSKVSDLISSRDCLQSHQVTDKMNNVRYQEADCPRPVAASTGSKKSQPLVKGDLRNWFFASKDKPSNKRKSEPPGENEASLSKNIKQG